MLAGLSTSQGKTMKLFLANTTKHIQHLLFRLPGNARIFEQKIAPGSQSPIYQDSSRETLEYILKQHTDTPKPFVIPVDEVGKHPFFVGMIYSFDKPVPSFHIEETFIHNDEELEKEGLENRKAAAVAINETLQEGAKEMGASVSELELSVTEQSRQGEKADTQKLQETIQVEQPGKKNKPGRKNRG